MHKEKGNGKIEMNRIIIGIIVTVVSALLIGVTTWNFAATQGAVQKEEHRVVHDKLNDKIDTNQMRLEDKLDSIQNLLIERHEHGE